MMFVLQRIDGQFVTPPGKEKSYTKLLQEARQFSTRDAAERDRCPENESVIAVADILRK